MKTRSVFQNVHLKIQYLNWRWSSWIWILKYSSNWIINMHISNDYANFRTILFTWQILMSIWGIVCFDLLYQLSIYVSKVTSFAYCGVYYLFYCLPIGEKSNLDYCTLNKIHLFLLVMIQDYTKVFPIYIFAIYHPFTIIYKIM